MQKPKLVDIYIILESFKISKINPVQYLESLY
jgi:hypothetical protein